MMQHLKECFRSNLWAMMGKFDEKIPSDYEFPIVPIIFSEMPRIESNVIIHDYPCRIKVVINEIILTDKFGGNSTYLRKQGRILETELINKEKDDLARFLDLEMERISDDVY